MKLTVIKGGMLKYRYDVPGGMSFAFNSLCEVGAPYQQGFRDEIARLGLNVEYGRFLEEKPWVADFMIKAIPKADQ